MLCEVSVITETTRLLRRGWQKTVLRSENKEIFRQFVKGFTSAHPGRRDIILDVPRLRLQPHRPCHEARHGLDMDVAVVPVRHTGTAVPRMAVETDA